MARSCDFSIKQGDVRRKIDAGAGLELAFECVAVDVDDPRQDLKATCIKGRTAALAGTDRVDPAIGQQKIGDLFAFRQKHAASGNAQRFHRDCSLWFENDLHPRRGIAADGKFHHLPGAINVDIVGQQQRPVAWHA